MKRIGAAILLVLCAVAMIAPGVVPSARAESSGDGQDVSGARQTGYQRPARSAEDIGAGYEKPTPTAPEPRGQQFRFIDIAVLAGAMLVAAWLILKFRSRLWLTVLLIGSLLYFGFYRAGCVCPIGSIQNVTLSVIDSSYTISFVVTALFLLPLLAALLFGRVFCGGVCPLGAVQDVLHRKNLPVPRLLDRILRWGRWLYLAAAIYFVVGGLALLGHDLTVKRDFIICRYDPFVNLFRSINFRTAAAGDWGRAFLFAGPWWMWLVTGATLMVSVFIGRPYCRWLCPYGALLGVCSRASWRKVTVMPDECIDCELCNDACAFGAIDRHAATKATCLACARCYRSCPLERVRLGWPVPPHAPAPAVGPAGRLARPPAPVERAPVRGRRLQPATDTIDVSYLDGLITLVGTTGPDGANALPILQAIQSHHNYLPYPALKRVVELTDLSMSDLVGLATFYNQFRMAPIGQHLVKICCGTACHVAGARRVSEMVRLYLGLSGEADTDAARRFTVQEVACVGCCSLAPVMQIDETTFGHLTPETAVKTLDSYTPKSHKRPAEHPPSHDTVVDDRQHHVGAAR